MSIRFSIYLGLGLLLNSYSYAVSLSSQYTVKTLLKNQAVEISALPPSGHHFNIDAPKSLTFVASTNKIKPVIVSKTHIGFKFPAAVARDAVLSLYVCDDKNTYCERHDLSLKWNGKDDYLVSDSSKSEMKKEETGAKTGTDTHGFILNDYSGALELAQSKKLPLLIDFYGIWCPPCNYLDQHVFFAPEFHKNSQRFVKLKIDVDSDANANLLTKYKIMGFPTLIVANTEGNEIYRIVGSRPKQIVLNELKKAHSLFANKGQLDSNDQKGRIAFDQGDYKSAENFLKDSKQYREFFLVAKANVMLTKLEAANSEEQGKLLEEYVHHVQNSVKEFPRSGYIALDLQSDLDRYYEGKKLEEKSKSLKKQMIASCHEMLKNPREAEDSGFPLGEVWIEIAKLHSKLGNKDLSKEAWEKSVNYFRTNSLSSKDKMHQVYYAYSLAKLDRMKEADEILESLQKHYPAEFTYYYEQAFIYHDVKKYEKSIELAKKALSFAYDNNRLKVIYLLAQAYRDSGQSKDANQLIDETLKKMKVVENSQGAVARYAKRFKDLQKTLIQ